MFRGLFGVADAAVWVDFWVSVCHRVVEGESVCCLMAE